MKTDTQLRSDVMEELSWAPAVTSGDIRVAAQDGVVTLSGTVPHYAEKMAAERVTQRVTGVKAIAEELEVNLDGIYKRSDSEVAAAVVNSLGWHVSIPDSVQAKVENGWVTLSGHAEWEFQRRAAGDAVRHMFGVKSVSNDIDLRPNVQSSDVKAKIEKTLKRDAEIDAALISVTSDGGMVTLAGTVHSWDQRAGAGMAAWSTPGLTSVANDLTVSY